MSTTLIAGNGFDLIWGWQTSYQEFLKYKCCSEDEKIITNPCVYNILLLLIYIITILIIVSYFYTLYVNYLQNYTPQKIKKRHMKNKRCFHLLRSALIPILILLSIILLFSIAIAVFNKNQICFGDLIAIPKNIAAWADFATCMTLPLALISFFYIYRTFQSQTLAARRTSFDTTFTQMFAQHNTLREKTSRHTILLRGTPINFFSYFRYEVFSKSSIKVKDLYKDFIATYDLQGAVDFKNYFKYIYHEVQMVIINEYLNENVKRKYIKLIQGQMNNDELFCYLINQIEYLSRVNDKRSIEYAKKLRQYDFFEDLCKDCNYKMHINTILKDNWELNNLIKNEWIK